MKRKISTNDGFPAVKAVVSVILRGIVAVGKMPGFHKTRRLCYEKFVIN